MNTSLIGKSGQALLDFANYFGDAFLGHAPDPKESSLKMAWHYGQMIGAGGAFAEYGEGTTPGPLIPLENIDKMPVYLFVGTNDPVATHQDNITL